MRLTSLLFAAVSLSALVACGGGEPEAKTPAPESTVTATKTAEPTTPPPTVASAEPPKEEPKPEPKPEPKKKTAKEVITMDGAVFMFSLADSADAKKLVDDDCAKKAGKDEKKNEACKKVAMDAAAGEGIKFVKDDKGEWWWVSFGTAKDKEVVYNKVHFKIASDDATKVTLTPEGKDAGTKPMKTLPKEMVIEVTDESTVALTDPKKGKLVYKKK